MVNDELKKRNVDLGTVTVRQIDQWIEARMQKLENRSYDHGYIEVDKQEMEFIRVFRAAMERMALAAHLDSPAILDSLERRRVKSIQRQNDISFEPR